MTAVTLSIRVDELTPSPTNPRKRFDEAALAELAESIKRQGVLQPILVRPQIRWEVRQSEVTGQWQCGCVNRAGGWNIHHGEESAEAAHRWIANNPAPYEIVAGERRWRAARLAGIAEIPALVRELTDVQAAEVQTIENLQREDLHPLELLRAVMAAAPAALTQAETKTKARKGETKAPKNRTAPASKTAVRTENGSAHPATGHFEEER